MENVIGVIICIMVVGVIIVIVKAVKSSNAKKLKKAEDELRNLDHVRLIDETLTNSGYRLSYFHSFSWGDNRYSITVGLYKGDNEVGEMNFYTHKISAYYLDYFGHHCRGDRKRGINNHMIFLNDAGIIITSNVDCSQPVPEWMKLCGEILRGFTICYPQWVEDCISRGVGDPRVYVNTVFNE